MQETTVVSTMEVEGVIDNKTTESARRCKATAMQRTAIRGWQTTTPIAVVMATVTATVEAET
jgi:hypothetical protein